MKFPHLFLAACAAFALTASSAFGVINVSFSGGGGSPISITLPAVSWEITNAAKFNTSATFGIGIAVGQTPATTISGNATGGNGADWSSDGGTTFSGDPLIFMENNALPSLIAGGIIWCGIASNQTATNGDTITYAGGTFGNDDTVAATFANGSYDLYLIESTSFEVVSTAATDVVPEPATYAALAGLAALAFMVVRRRK